MSNPFAIAERVFVVSVEVVLYNTIIRTCVCVGLAEYQNFHVKMYLAIKGVFHQMGGGQIGV